MGKSAFDFFRQNGLLNLEQEDIGILMTAEKGREVFSFCTSARCCISIFGKKSKVYKHVDGNINSCPDCGHALVWQTKKGKAA